MNKCDQVAVKKCLFVVDSFTRQPFEGKEICMVFLNVSKAFDKVWHKGILYKLRVIGVEGKLLDWLANYLIDREIRVVINGKTAPWAKTNAGVPQGSILGPLLFFVFINDVVNNIESDTSISLLMTHH